MGDRRLSFGTIVAVLGSILITVGIAWLIAQNWHYLSALVKIVILAAATMGAYSAGTYFRLRNYNGIGKALIVLGGLLYTLSIFLIAQIFSTSTTWQGTAWLLLLSWIGVFGASYIFDSGTSLIVALGEFLIWVIIQFIAFGEHMLDAPLGFLALIFLSIGVLFYGLSLWHRVKNSEFARLYQWWTAFYFLAFVYLLTFQIVLPTLWSGESYGSNIISFLTVFAAGAIIVVGSGIIKAKQRRTVMQKEINAFILIVILLLILIGVSSFVSRSVGTCSQRNCYEYNNKISCDNAPKSLNCVWNDEFGWGAECDSRGMSCGQYKNEKSCVEAQCQWRNTYCVVAPHTQPQVQCQQYYTRNSCIQNDVCKWGSYRTSFFGRNKSVPLPLWGVWIFANIIFILIILMVIGYGTWQRIPTIINIGIAFFTLEIITRYLGFIFDFWGYTSLSFIFITGGIILLGGGWLIESWRRKLIIKAKGKKLKN